MGRKNKHNAKLLEIAFSRPEWEYLKRHSEFKARVESANLTLNDFEEISALGNDLLKDWEDKNPNRARFRRSSERRKKPRAGKSN